MKQKSNSSSEGMGLLANGSSCRWDLAVEESLDRVEWSLEIDGQQAYLVFQLRDLEVIPEAYRFLHAGPGSVRGGALHLGRFGSVSVSLLWDDEPVTRCFLVVGPKARATLRLSLEAEDVQMLCEALAQVMSDLPRKDSE